ncbi:response regulator [uncultured Croceitalea sp.]|uniref:response regulator n=1 Tax=uncultured Croceitalea sp. TaxID=1798908 RepID=UPI0033064D86
MIKHNYIYIVDDDAITIFGIKKLLSQLSRTPKVREFGNGKTALQAITNALKQGKQVPDFIFLDINMPIMDGWQFLEEFLKLSLDKKVTINIVTSSIDPCDKKKWLSYRTNSKHRLLFNNKPIFSIDLEHIMRINLAS